MHRPLIALALLIALAPVLGPKPTQAAPTTHRLVLPVVAQHGGIETASEQAPPVLDAATAEHARRLVVAHPDRRGVLLVGDSITVDERFMPGVDPGRPAAYGGFTAHDLFRSEARCRPSLLPCELALHAPAVVVVMVGTNDQRLGADPADGSGLAAVLDAVLDAGALPIASTIPPYRRDPATGARVPAYNATVVRVAAERHVPVVDVWAALQALPDQGISDDGIHPTDAGYAARTAATLAALDAVRTAVAAQSSGHRLAQ